jgi:hypothetical protein
MVDVLPGDAPAKNGAGKVGAHVGEEWQQNARGGEHYREQREKD